MRKINKQLAYLSQATEALNDLQLLEILNQSRENNSRDEITGFLMHCDGNFFQIIEGKHEPIDQLYARLLKDTRHTSVTCVLERDIEERMFALWSMAFRSLAFKECGAVSGYSSFLNNYLAMQQQIPGAREAFLASDVSDIILDLRKTYLD